MNAKRQYNTIQLYFTTLATHKKKLVSRWGVSKHVETKAFVSLQSDELELQRARH